MSVVEARVEQGQTSALRATKGLQVSFTKRLIRLIVRSFELAMKMKSRSDSLLGVSLGILRLDAWHSTIHQTVHNPDSIMNN